MEIIKKIGLWVAFVFLVIIKLPVSLIGFVVSYIELWLIDIGGRVIEGLNDSHVNAGWNRAADRNVENCEGLKDYFSDMKTES